MELNMKEPTEEQVQNEEIEKVKVYRERVALTSSSYWLARKSDAKQSIAKKRYQKRIKAQIAEISKKYNQLKKENLDTIAEMLITLSLHSKNCDFLPLPVYPTGESEMSECINKFIEKFEDKIKDNKELTDEDITILLEPIKTRYDAYFERMRKQWNALCGFLVVLTIMAAVLMVVGFAGIVIIPIIIASMVVALFVGQSAMFVKAHIDDKKKKVIEIFEDERKKLVQFITNYNEVIRNPDAALTLSDEPVKAKVIPEEMSKEKEKVINAHTQVVMRLKEALIRKMVYQLTMVKEGVATGFFTSSFGGVSKICENRVQKINKRLNFIRDYYGISQDILPDVSFREIKENAILILNGNSSLPERDLSVRNLNLDIKKHTIFKRSDKRKLRCEKDLRVKSREVRTFLQACATFYKARKAQAKAVVAQQQLAKKL